MGIKRTQDAARPETSDTVEIDVERKLGKCMNVQATAYGYRLRNFLEGVLLPDGLLQYQNLGTSRAEGIELEVNGRPFDWLEATVSYAVPRSRDTDNEIVTADDVGRYRSGASSPCVKVAGTRFGNE